MIRVIFFIWPVCSPKFVRHCSTFLQVLQPLKSKAPENWLKIREAYFVMGLIIHLAWVGSFASQKRSQILY